MENTQPTKTKNESESQADTSDASIKSGLVAVTEQSESKSSSETTTATMSKGSRKTWTSAALEELKLKVGLVAGALSDFQNAGGIVVTKQVESDGILAIKIYLVAEGINIKSIKTQDGLDLVAEPSGTVAEGK